MHTDNTTGGAPARHVKIAPSVLAADFARLDEEIRRVDLAGADAIHLDVMDGHFVPNITIGPVVLAGIRPCTKRPFDTHLMITDPARYAEPFAGAGADRIVFHVEVVGDALPLIRKIRSMDVEPGLAISPDTDVKALDPYYAHVAGILVMTVYPGFGGQAYLDGGTDRINAIATAALAVNPTIDIEVDGGINRETIVQAARAGANMIVAGTAVFRSDDPASAIATLRSAAEEGLRKRRQLPR